VAWAVDYAHRQGVIHRDLKPNNILLERRTGRAYVADFGIARVMDEAPLFGGLTFGTFIYTSPEQAAGIPADSGATSTRLVPWDTSPLRGRPRSADRPKTFGAAHQDTGAAAPCGGRAPRLHAVGSRGPLPRQGSARRELVRRPPLVHADQAI
jgi:serine/threonine-protein kinase